MTRLIIFDFDGVLADSLAPMLKYAQQVCHEFGLERTPTKADLEALDRMEFSEFAVQLGVPDHQIETFVRRNFELFAGRMEPLGIIPGMDSVVSRLAETCLLVIITGNSCQVVEKFLATHQMGDKFGIILCSEHPGTRLEKIRKVIDQYQASIAETYMVGDAVSDIRAAREARIMSIAVSWGHQSRQKLIKEDPLLVVDQPQDLLDYFSEIVNH